MHLPRRTLLITSTAIVLTGVSTAAGAAIAASPVSGGIIFGCYKTAGTHGSHSFVLQNAGTACPSGDTPIKWNQSQPTFYTKTSGPYSVPPQGGADAAQGCTGTDTAISGGAFSDNGATTQLVMSGSFPTQDGRWEVQMTNLSATNTSTFELYAVCENQAG